MFFASLLPVIWSTSAAETERGIGKQKELKDTH